MSENTKGASVTETQADAGPHATPDQERAAQKRRDALAATNGGDESEARAEAPRGRTASKRTEKA